MDKNQIYRRRFWEKLDGLIESSEIRIDRPKGSRHPSVRDMIYPLDYGFLKGTAAMDGDGVDLWLGTMPERKLRGVIVTVDTWRKDAEIKLLVGTTDEEIEMINDFLNERDTMSGILVLREE